MLPIINLRLFVIFVSIAKIFLCKSLGVGFRVGGVSGNKYFVLQVHYGDISAFRGKFVNIGTTYFKIHELTCIHIIYEEFTTLNRLCILGKTIFFL